MPPVNKGRHTAAIEGDFVVFIIGMRFNKLWKINRWWPVFVAMPRMLQKLAQDPTLGLLGTRMAVGGRTTTMVQYWRSFEDLERFSRSPDQPHLEPWRAYNRKIAASGDVGVYHETYRVSAGTFESVYANMPTFGLGSVGGVSPVGRRTETARARMDGAEAATAREWVTGVTSP